MELLISGSKKIPIADISIYGKIYLTVIIKN